MKVPIFKKSLFCLDLTIGAAVIGWLGSIIAILDITVSIYKLTGIDVSLDLQTGFHVVLSILFLAASICLMMATQNESRRLVISWLVTTVFIGIATNVMFVYFGLEANSRYTILSLGICDLLLIYVWLCIYSYYHDLKTGY